MIEKYQGIISKIYALINLQFCLFVIDYDTVPIAEYSFINLIKSGVERFDGSKIYIDTSSVSSHEIVSLDYIIQYGNRPSRANMMPYINSCWLAKLKDSPKFISVYKYSDYELDNLIFSTGFLGIQSSSKAINNFIYSLISSKQFQEQKNRVSVGATMQSINNDVFLNLEVPNVDGLDATAFGESVDHLYENTYRIQKKIKRLKVIKQSLLEKFFS